MTQQFIGEIRMFGGSFAPIDWHFCDGSLLAISEYAPLYNLIGTTYGGNGTTNFALPNLQGRVPVHQGTSSGGTYVMGESSGTQTVTLNAAEIPGHVHTLNASTGGTTNTNPSGQAPHVGATIYDLTLTPVTMAANAISQNQGGQPHNNLMPFLAINFIIALYGIYPSQG